MVGLEVVVTDQQNNRLTGITVSVHVIPSGDPLLGTTKQYNLTPQKTNALGIAEWSNVEAGAEFIVTANGSPNYTNGSGSTSTTLTQGGYVDIVLSGIMPPTSTSSGMTCPSGFQYDQSSGQCVQTSTVGTVSSVASITDWITKYWYIFAIVLILVVIGIVVSMIYKSKGKTTTNVEAKLI